jgi:hypothetical protein
MFGGVACVARALLTMDNTTMILVKDVIIIKIDGAIDSTVMSMMVLKILEVVEPPISCSMFNVNVCANAESDTKQMAAKIKQNKAIFLIIFLALRRVKDMSLS